VTTRARPLTPAPPGQAEDTVFAAFERTARAHGARPFLHAPGRAELGYAEALERIEAIAARYRARGWRRGHRVALLLENRPEFLLHFLALNSLGASAVPLNPDYRAAELEYVLGHSEAALVVTLPQHAAKFPGRPIVALAGDFDPPAAGAPGDANECALLYTSGTTGKPKGCLLGDFYFLNLGRQYITEAGLCAMREGEERLITPLPLFHMNALACSTMAMILAAGCIVQLDRFHPGTWWEHVARSQATIVHYLGVMPAILLAQAEGPHDRAHCVRFGYGANANPKDHAAFEARFGFPLIEGWAMTETGGGAVISASREPRHVGTRCFGAPRPGIEVRIVDEHERDAPEGEPGELLVRRAGPDPRRGFFSGYLKDPGATEHAWRGGWFHTGDAVRRGPDGMLHFVDRRKNIIRRSGENIAALEVEAALAGHPAVGQVAVIAAPDPVRDEEVMACVVPSAGTPRTRDTAVSIQDWCLERLAYFKAPGYVAFIDQLPTTSTNKVQKARLEDFGANPLASPECFDVRSSKKRDPARDPK
jgi:acyl-CoA synthetase (AMP-forming)/AMP-acid ligase II